MVKTGNFFCFVGFMYNIWIPMFSFAVYHLAFFCRSCLAFPIRISKSSHPLLLGSTSLYLCLFFFTFLFVITFFF
ncbi:hypothetical protein DFH27DRAFT_80424 [Peziza echinospora]|nr:hypothetical protein DFH27DRAFT_80424 [Peziza echinospora]